MLETLKPGKQLHCQDGCPVDRQQQSWPWAAQLSAFLSGTSASATCWPRWPSVPPHGWIHQAPREGDRGLRNKATKSKRGQVESLLWDAEEGAVHWWKSSCIYWASFDAEREKDKTIRLGTFYFPKNISCSFLIQWFSKRPSHSFLATINPLRPRAAVLNPRPAFRLPWHAWSFLASTPFVEAKGVPDKVLSF